MGSDPTERAVTLRRPQANRSGGSHPGPHRASHAEQASSNCARGAVIGMTDDHPNCGREAPLGQRAAAIALAVWLVVTVAACEASDASTPPRPGTEKAAAQPGREAFPTGGTEGEYVALGDSFAAGQGAPDVVDYPSTCRPPVRQPPRPPDPPPCTEQRYYQDGTDRSGVNLCHRSVNAYSVDVARALDLRLTFRACDGAKIEEYYLWNIKQKEEPSQREAFAGLKKDQVKLVTLSLGGNDVGFGKVAENCAVTKVFRRADTLALLGPIFFLSVAGLPDCRGQVDKARAALPTLTNLTTQRECQPPVAQPPRPGTPTPPPCTTRSTRKLVDLYRDIRRQAPNARILVLGYPRLFPIRPQGYCSTGFPPTVITVAEMTSINRFTDELNRATRLAIAQANATRPRGETESAIEYVDVQDAFAGHDACVDSDQERWVNRLRNLVFESSRNESFHPTIEGQAAFRDRVMACWRDTQQCAPAREPKVFLNIAAWQNDSAPTLELVEAPSVIPGTVTLRSIRWRNWGADVATAEAIVDINVCVPDCTEANAVTGPATLQASGIVEVDGKLIYSCLKGTANPNRLLRGTVDPSTFRRSTTPFSFSCSEPLESQACDPVQTGERRMTDIRATGVTCKEARRVAKVGWTLSAPPGWRCTYSDESSYYRCTSREGEVTFNSIGSDG